MDGHKAVEQVIGVQIPIEFSEIMYTTDSYTALPMTFFQKKHLRHTIDHAATLPTLKSNSREGETKGSYILVVNGTGFPGVFQGNPYRNPSKPAPLSNTIYG